jgi:hypothetical protein
MESAGPSLQLVREVCGQGDGRSPSAGGVIFGHLIVTNCTKLSLEFVATELPIMSLPLQHTKGHEAADHMMLLSPLRARLTAGQAQWILADPEDFLDLATHAIQATHLRGRQRQAMGGVVLLAVSDNQHFEAPVPPAALGPLGGPPMKAEGVAIEPAILFETAHAIPPIVPNPLQESSGGVPRIKEHKVRVTAQAIAGIAEQG